MDDFLSLKNFKHLFKLLNIYSQKKYNTKLNFKNFKKIIGNSMYEINDNFGDKLNTKKKNILILRILKEIIDEKQQVDNFFQVESEFKTNNQITNDNLYNTNNYNNFKEKEEKKEDINILEKRLENEKKVYEKIINNNNNEIDKNIQQKQDIEKYLKEMVMEKPKKEKINLEEPIKNINQEIIISPEKYKKTINKYIKKIDLLIDSRDRNYNSYDSNDYIINLNNEINNVFSIELINCIIPNSEYIVNLNNNILYIEESSGIIPVEIPIGNYSKNELVVEIENSLNSNINLASNYKVTSEDVSIILNDIEIDDSNFIQFTGSNIHYIFNNNISQYWSSNLSDQNPSFFIYDFKKSVLIKEYSFISKNLNRPKDFNLEISEDGMNWIILQSIINVSSSPNKYLSYSFPNNYLFTRYVKFTVTNTSAGNTSQFAINNMNFVTYSNTKIQIESDLVGNQQNYFNLRFLGGTNIYNDNVIPYYKERSIGPLIGFLPNDKTDLSFYSSDKDVILKNDKIIKLDINDNYFFIELESDSGKYTYKNQMDIVKLLDNLKNFKKLNIKIKNINNTLYNFNGFEHSFLLRLYHYNTNQVFKDSI